MSASDFISSYFLESHYWEKSKTEKGTWTRGDGVSKVYYDGTNWYHNGKRIEDSISKNPELKVPSVNPKLPPPGFISVEDYYSRMMENK